MPGKESVVSRRATMKAGEKTYEFEALSLKDWVQAEHEALRQYKKGLIETYADNLDSLPEAIRESQLTAAFEKASTMTLDDMPKKELDIPAMDPATRKPLMRRGKPVTIKQQVPYQAWWMSNTPSGQIYTIWLSMKKCKADVTLEDIDEIFAKPELLEQAAQLIGELSQGSLGN